MTPLLHTQNEKESIIKLNRAFDIFAAIKVPRQSLEKILI